MTQETYEKILGEWAAAERAAADKAKIAGDEQLHSIHLMKASMLGDMLKVLGRVEMTGARRGILQNQMDALKKQAAVQREHGDYDSEQKTLIKMDTIRRARDLIYGGNEGK